LILEEHVSIIASVRWSLDSPTEFDTLSSSRKIEEEVSMPVKKKVTKSRPKLKASMKKKAGKKKKK
jgi:hypothetical protein